MPIVLTRRLGLIVGCSMGVVVFLLLASVLSYLKIKKQRELAKQEQPVQPEFISYQHFTLYTDGTRGHSTSVTTGLGTNS